jgi:hypothetical protein
MNDHHRFLTRLAFAFFAVVILLLPASPLAAVQCNREIFANVVAIDQAFFWNRLGAAQPQGMIYALRRDVSETGQGGYRLRDGKRARPLVLRMNVGDCLTINFQNRLMASPVDNQQPVERKASVHVVGMQLVNTINSDGSYVGLNNSSLVAPGGLASYKIYAEREGGYLMYSAGAMTGGEGDGGSLNAGLFGAVIVEPASSEWYRSQVTAEQFALTKTEYFPGSDLWNNPEINIPLQPQLIDYWATYPVPPNKPPGPPVLQMLWNNEIIYSDLTAIITGPSGGPLPEGTYPAVKVTPNREQPFREIVTIYHDEIGAVQAFPQFHGPLEHTLHSVRDAFAINYGTGGIGAEILANRFGVGPMAGCTECKYEDFFLSAWAVGDPAMIVDVPANAPCTKTQIQSAATNCFTVGLKATKAFYPDDPSNVYHSYLRDHVKFRILHAGSKEHHIHHQHTHQWLHTPDEDDSAYLDSQAIGPGAAFTLEMVYDGSGNRNLSVGDSIFHCHFYPHFAQGMWAMWRVHDVLELGTELDENGRPAPGSRAYPDGEIAAGTPIPAVVPLPTIAMAPLPEADVSIVNGQVVVSGAGNPGYPFFVPGVAGHRPPHPPLDTIDDGGLPRHVITGGTFTEQHTRLDFSKELVTANAKELPENGTPVEEAAMAYHAVRAHPSLTPEGIESNFITNGLPPVAGAPYADPCISDAGQPLTDNMRLYQSANIQLDVKFNKVAWHFPQQRISTLWQDVASTLNGTRPPEPLFFRANSRDCITFQLTNLVPGVYEQDDFQVRTPTDITGQHIHLVKFDVTASDGAANGYNYEDGSFAPDDVIERIEAINAFGGLLQSGGGRVQLTPQPHPVFGTLGAQTTVQRWYADDVLNNAGADRTLRTVFTHDHFGPSSHQQVGLYAGLVVEPEGSAWLNPAGGPNFGTRPDGGPTSWRADIIPPDPNESYREFLLAFADFQHAYWPNQEFPDPDNVINPPGRKEAGLPFLLRPPDVCPSGGAPPCPEAVAADDVGTMVINYRNEPLALRVRDPLSNLQASGLAGDLSFAFSSNVNRADPLLNVQPAGTKLSNGVQEQDPFTPLLEAYQGDRVQVRVLIGAHEEGHNFSVNGVKWLFEPSSENSGYRNSQMMGISEHFEFIIPAVPQTLHGNSADFLYTAGRATDDLWNGLWGIMRAYKGAKPGLNLLPNNADAEADLASVSAGGICPNDAPMRFYNVSAVRADLALPNNTLTYNFRTAYRGTLHDPTAIIYVRDADLLADGRLRSGLLPEPLVLRANAGDCISVTLTNRLPASPIDLNGYNTLPMIVNDFNNNNIWPSSHVGLHPQLVYYDVSNSDGQNVGLNPVQTAAPGSSVNYTWYAGGLIPGLNPGELIPVPYEFGASNLMSSDPIKHAHKGAFGALIIEPANSSWDPAAYNSTVITTGATSFREHVLQFQTDVNFRHGNDGSAVKLTADAEDPEDSGQKAVNYRSEPMWNRFSFPPDEDLGVTRTKLFSTAFSNSQVGGADPQTPVFVTPKGAATRFRILNAGGHARNNVFALHGHVWQELPYTNASTTIGNNPLSQWTGAFMGIGPSSHFDAVLQHGAGSGFLIPGDYLFRAQPSFLLDGGLWGIFRVQP